MNDDDEARALAAELYAGFVLAQEQATMLSDTTLERLRVAAWRAARAFTDPAGVAALNGEP